MALRILNYIPAQLYESSKNTYVGYYIVNPITGKKRRVRIKVNRIKNQKERRRYARQLIVEINKKLEQGWNPFLEQEAPKSFSLLSSAIDTFLNLKGKELRYDSIRTYKSILKSFLSWAEQNVSKNKDVYVLNITQNEAHQYLYNLYINLNKSEKVYNNHKKMLSTFWVWLIENGYSKVNVFAGIKKKKEKPKNRIFIEENIRDKIFNFFRESKQYNYLAICYLTFYGLLRPKEISLLRSSDINFTQNYIRVRAEISKTRKERIISMPTPLKNILMKIGVEKIETSLYIFGKRGFMPDKSPSNSRYIGKVWAKMRIELNLDMNIQFYGLKDSGIIELLRAGVSPEAVRDQAGHSSLEMTNKYVQIARTAADPQILDKVNF